MPLIFEKFGVRFVYPDTWQVDEREVIEGDGSITVQSPEGAFWSFTVHEREVSPEKAALTALDALREEYTDHDVTNVTDELAGHDLIGYELNFYYLDLTNTAWIRATRSPVGTVLMVGQAEDRDFDAVEPVFRAMSQSLLQSWWSPKPAD